MPAAPERVTVGLVRGLHGLRGAVRVEVLSDDPARFEIGSVLHAEGDDRPLTVTWTGPARTGLLVRFAELPDRGSAERLRDRYLEAVPTEPLPAGSYYWHQVQGLTAVTTKGLELGRVTEVFRAGAGEVYVVRGGPLGEVLVPAVRAVVVELDPAAGRLVVDPVALDLPSQPPRRRRRHELPPAERKAARRTRGRRRTRAHQAPDREPAAGEPTARPEPVTRGPS